MLATKQKIRITRTVAPLVTSVRRSLGVGVVTKVRRNGLNWRLEFGKGVNFAIYILGRFERERRRQYGHLLRPGKVALDIGANNKCQVRAGGQSTLRRFQSAAIMELAPYIFHGGENSLKPFINLIRDPGYRLIRSPSSADLPHDAAALTRYIKDGESINAWAIRA